MKLYTLENDFQKIEILSTGAAIYKWTIKELNQNIVLTNEDINDYKTLSGNYFSQTIGRVTNRIRNGRITIDNKEYLLNKNDEKHLLHSGVDGIWNKEFKFISRGKTLCKLHYYSKTGESGFPGNVDIYVMYKLKKYGLTIIYEAKTDELTPLNITNHAYFNFGDDTILNYHLQVLSSKVVELDEDMIPTGKLIEVKNTPFDFNKRKTIKRAVRKLNYAPTFGIDHNFIFDLKKVLTLENDKLKLKLNTTYPSIQIYTGNFVPKNKVLGIKENKQYQAICLEPQYETDAINTKMRDILLKPDEKYHEEINYKLKIKK